MAGFSAITIEKPPSAVVVPRTAFDPQWDDRPASDVCIGLRLIAEDDLQTARVEASKVATRHHPKALTHPESHEAHLWALSFNDSLRRWIVARGTCDPNDIRRPCSVWATAPEDIVPMALTRDGLDLVFDAWERMRISTDITQREATDDEFIALAGIPERLATIEPTRAARIRRLVSFCLDEIDAS